jgi:predicted transcriptional regulator
VYAYLLLWRHSHTDLIADMPFNSGRGVLIVKRSSFEIMAEILNLCKKPQTKTKIMYMTNLSWRMLHNYLSTLQSKGLIEVHHSLTKYAATPKGVKFVETWKKLAKLL